MHHPHQIDLLLHLSENDMRLSSLGAAHNAPNRDTDLQIKFYTPLTFLGGTFY
jgi:hypothetical protein